jgi:putative protein kinase ArgK-like GTPase of G3E family
LDAELQIAEVKSGTAYTVGITGSPGAGKSTLTSSIISHLRERDEEVAVLAIDPSSPFTGGAILGDRVRMQDHATDPGVFIRSMATRGHLGGLAAATGQVLSVLAASGKDVILVETVGVGQDEVEIVGTADVSVVVLVPGLGDEVQALKAGIMEIADVFVVNKADRAGVEQTESDLPNGLQEDRIMSYELPDKELPETTAQQINDLFDSAELTKALETEEFKQFLDYIPIAIVVSKFFRGDQRICYANKAFEILTGRATKDCAGRGWSILAAFKDENDLQTTLELAMLRGAVR